MSRSGRGGNIRWALMATLLGLLVSIFGLLSRLDTLPAFSHLLPMTADFRASASEAIQGEHAQTSRGENFMAATLEERDSVEMQTGVSPSMQASPEKSTGLLHNVSHIGAPSKGLAKTSRLASRGSAIATKLTDATNSIVHVGDAFDDLAYDRTVWKSSWCELGRIQSRTAEGLDVTAWGDVYFAMLEDIEGNFFTRPRILDLRDGKYAMQVRCGSLPPGTYKLTVQLEFVLRRDRFPPNRWPLADEGGRVSILDEFDSGGGHSLDLLYDHSRKLISGSGLSFAVPGASKSNSHSDLPSWVLHLEPCVGGRLPSSQFGKGDDERPAGRWLSLKTPGLSEACKRAASPISRICAHSELLLLDRYFHHVYVEDGCYYPLMGRKDFEQCLKGRHIAMFGDSVTHGMFIDAMHMWASYQRNSKGEIINKYDVCQWNAKEGLYKLKRGPQPLTMSIPGGGSIKFSEAVWKPFRYGLENLRKNSDVLGRDWDRADIVVFQSCGHDISFFKKPPETPKKRIFARYRENLQLLFHDAKKWLNRKPKRRFIWMSCSAQAAQRTPIAVGKYKLITAHHLYARIMNRIARELVSSFGFEYFDQFSALYLAETHDAWWDTRDGVPTGDIHHHERVCPKAYNSTFQHLGDKGYLSKMKCQMLFRHICGNG